MNDKLEHVGAFISAPRDSCICSNCVCFFHIDNVSLFIPSLGVFDVEVSEYLISNFFLTKAAHYYALQKCHGSIRIATPTIHMVLSCQNDLGQNF